MSNFLKTGLLALGLSVAATVANATPITLGGEGPDLQTAINNLYRSAACPTCSLVSQAPNVNTDQVMPDELWAIEASGGAVATLVIEVAGNAGTNTFGIYNTNTGATYQLFGGAASGGAKAFIDINEFGDLTINFGATYSGALAGGQFGFYLGTSGGKFYSESAKNGGADQMVAFQGDGDRIKLPGQSSGIWGSSSYILAWEDVALGVSDRDYQDFVVYVESVTPVPEPATLALFGLGLVGIALARRRKSGVAA